MLTLTDEQKHELIQAARKARELAYAPYSHYQVGAALLTRSGQVFTGVNVENAAYPNGICAECVAIYKAVSEGSREFTAMAIVTANGGFPCGLCRQNMAEFSLDMLVLIANSKGEILQEITVAALLPGAFRPEDLIKK